MAHKTFASIRFTGDLLEPALLSDIMRVRPTLSYHKGETFHVGKNEKPRIGRTGLWLLSSEHAITSLKLNTHIRYLSDIINGEQSKWEKPPKSDKIRRYVLLNKIDFVMNLYWHGEYEEPEPVVPINITRYMQTIGGHVETDFDRDSENPTSKHLIAAG